MKLTSDNVPKIFRVLLLSGIALVSFSSSAEIYKWKDAQGIVQYSDKPPPQITTKPTNKQLKALLDAQTMCSASPQPKNASSSAVYNAATRSEMASFTIPGSSVPTTTGGVLTSIGIFGGVQILNSPKASLGGTIVATAPTTKPPVTTPPVTTSPVTTPPVTTPPVTTPPVTTPPVTTPPVTTPPSMGNMPVVNLALIPAGFAGYSDLRVLPVDANSEKIADSPDDKGAFRVWCQYSHMLNDDPIVFPGGQGKSHLHTFFGNTGANYTSTSESIRTTGNSTCNGGIMNRSSYWVPSAILNTAPLKPDHSLIYYKHQTVTAFPKGLKMIAGSMASTGPQSSVAYECNELYSSHSDHIPPCAQGGLLSMIVYFPSCWDGKNLDSVDHKSHMAYADTIYSACPAAYPVKLPTITVITYYRLTDPTGTANIRLSSDNYPTSLPAGYSGHADVMVGWDETIEQAWVKGCVNAGKDCHASLLGDGRYFY